mgnify:CR=1 FL=1
MGLARFHSYTPPMIHRPSSYRSASLGELLDLWDEPLESSVRAELLAELDDRGYRTSSLPPPPAPSHSSAKTGHGPSTEPQGWITIAQVLLLFYGVMGALNG